MKKVTILITFLMLFIGCSKDDNSDPNPNNNLEEDQITGSVILPEGSTHDLNNLSVQSYNGNSSISSDSYIINIAEDNHNFLFVSDANDKVILMGYNYPGQTNFDINAESTIIALAMSMPIASLLTDVAKVDFVNKIKQNSNFSSVVAKMETLIKDGISPLDTNQEVFLNEFLSLFENAVTSKTSKTKLEYNQDPVNIIKTGNKITFVNGGKTYETSIGIYKDDKRIEYLELDRVQFFATSTSEALNTANNLATANFDGTEIEQKTFEFKEDGEYQIKIGTGFNTDFSSYESTEALVDNVSKWSMDFVLGVIPLKGGSKADCAQHVLGEIKTYTALYTEGKKINTVADVLTISYDISKSFIQNLGKGIECISKNPEYLKFSKLANKLFGWDAWVSRTGTGLNISVGIGQWIYDNSSMELCYQVNGNEMTECGIDLSGSWIFSYYNASPVYGVDYLHEQKRFTCDKNGYAETSEVRFPFNPSWPGEGQEWLEQGGPVTLTYNNGVISSYFSVLVEDVNAIVFYSSNWNTLYTVDDYYWKVKLERQ